MILTPFLLLGYLVNREFVFSGRLEIETDFSQPLPRVGDFFPWDRVSINQKDSLGYSASIIGEPVYFDLKLPRPFKQARAEISYENKGVSVFQIGVQASAYDWEYQLKPIENRYLDKLAWTKISDGGLTLFERKKKFDKISDFLATPPPLNQIVTYNYKLNYDFRIPNYQPTSGLEIDRTLRGRHVFYTYLDGEPLDFSFKIQDINRHAGPAPVEIDVYQRDKMIYTNSLVDDGIIDGSGRAGEKRALRIFLPNLARGVYKIEIKASDDIFISGLKTKEHLLAVLNHLYLADNKNYQDSLPDIQTRATTVFTNGRRISFGTAHPTALQTIKIGNQNFKIKEAHQQYSLKPVRTKPGELLTIFSPQSDLQIETNGLFSFTRESFFDPLVNEFEGDWDLTPEVNYLITTYQSPQKINELEQGTVDFDLAPLYFKDNHLRLAFSLPGLAGGQEIKLRRLKFTLEREPITVSNFWSRLLDYFSRIFKKS